MKRFQATWATVAAAAVFSWGPAFIVGCEQEYGTPEGAPEVTPETEQPTPPIEQPPGAAPEQQPGAAEPGAPEQFGTTPEQQPPPGAAPEQETTPQQPGPGQTLQDMRQNMQEQDALQP